MASGAGAAPVDIKCDTLIDWLLRRNVIPKKWLEALKKVHAGVTKAIKMLPDDDAVQRLVADDAQPGYYACQEVFAALLDWGKRTGNGGKTLFGNYKHAVLHEWYNLLESYKKNDIYLAEAARAIVQQAKYDIPDLKDSIVRDEKRVGVLSRKLREIASSQAEEEKKRAARCVEWGIQGANVKRELEALPEALPALLYALDESLHTKDLEDAVTYHERFVAFQWAQAPPVVPERSRKKGAKKGSASRTKDRPASGLGVTKAATAGEVLMPLVALVHSPLPPRPVDESKGDGGSPAVMGEAIDIDWGGDEDWGFSMDDVDLAPSSPGGGGGAEGAGSGGGTIDINWDIDATPDPAESKEEAKAAEPAELDGRPNLKSLTVQERLIDNLLELIAFLRSRVTEMRDKRSAAFVDAFREAPREVQDTSAEQIERSYLPAAEKALAVAEDERVRRLQKLAEGDRYLLRIVDTFLHHEMRVAKLETRASGTRSERADLVQSIDKAQPRLERARAAVKSLLSNVEKELSERFKRQVRVIGTNLSA